MKIKSVHGRQILDSRGFPTIECSIELDNGARATASVPAGASVGRYEAVSLYDHDNAHFGGKGVLKVLELIQREIAPLLIKKDLDVIAIDKELIDLDGTSDKSRLGANALLAVSIAVVRAQAMSEGIELFILINQLWGFERPSLPICMFNIINGGMHADSGLAVQEFMVMPRAKTIREQLEVVHVLYENLRGLLSTKHYSQAVGDEGGFAPHFVDNGRQRESAALDLIMHSISLSASPEVALCLDVAASHFYDPASKKYRMHHEALDAGELIAWYELLCKKYPIASIEDALDQDDWSGWKRLTEHLGKAIQLVGDDIFVTNCERIERGINYGVANAVVIKPNQIGTVSETIAAIKLCKQVGYKTIISHRSGETNDSFIADLAVGTAAGQLKAGAPVRGERVAKYNRLLAIEELLF